MLSVKKILYKILEHHVAETGTNNNWTYRKWSDGTAECWRTLVDDRPSTAFTSTGSVYFRNVTGINFPSSFFIARPAVTVNCEMGNIGAASATSVTTSGMTISEMSAVSAARSVTLDIYAIGKWK